MGIGQGSICWSWWEVVYQKVRVSGLPKTTGCFRDFFINIFLVLWLAKILQVCSCVVSVHQKKICQCKLRASVVSQGASKETPKLSSYFDIYNEGKAGGGKVKTENWNEWAGQRWGKLLVTVTISLPLCKENRGNAGETWSKRKFISAPNPFV